MQNFEGSISKWDIVVLPFPYVDSNTEKRRPALVVSSNEYNAETGLLWVLMITTTQQEWPYDIKITDLNKANLPAPSKIRCAKIATVEASRVVRVAGTLATEDLEAVKMILDELR